MTDDTAPDARFVLANERTFLAYIRTALALQVAGLGVLQFLTHAHDWVRVVLGLALIVVGSTVAVIGVRRWSQNDRAIRAGNELARVSALPVIAVLVVAIPLLAAIVLTVLG